MLPALIAAGASLASGLMASQNSRKANEQSAANAARQEALQREFAQNGIQWKVADAKAAGIHPLYALGANTVSYAPQSVGISTPDTSGFANAGQNLGRAIASTQTPDTNQQALNNAMFTQQIEGIKLDNDIKRTKLASDLATTRLGAGPPMPTGGTSDIFNAFGTITADDIKLGAPSIKTETRRDVTDPAAPSYIPGAGPSVGLMRNSTGGYDPVMPPELAESLESDYGGQLAWLLRNRLLPNIYSTERPNLPTAEHEEVVWNRIKQQWEVRPTYETQRRFNDFTAGARRARGTFHGAF